MGITPSLCHRTGDTTVKEHRHSLQSRLHEEDVLTASEGWGLTGRAPTGRRARH